MISNWHQPYSVKVDAGIDWKGEKDGVQNDETARCLPLLDSRSNTRAGMPVTEKIGFTSASAEPA